MHSDANADTVLVNGSIFIHDENALVLFLLFFSNLEDGPAERGVGEEGGALTDSANVGRSAFLRIVKRRRKLNAHCGPRYGGVEL